jgi:hypothetical protein
VASTSSQGLEARCLREQRAHAEFVDPQKDWLFSSDGRPPVPSQQMMPRRIFPAY